MDKYKEALRVLLEYDMVEPPCCYMFKDKVMNLPMKVAIFVIIIVGMIQKILWIVYVNLQSWWKKMRKDEIKVDYVLKDMIISALRYALGRKTYITQETAEFIMENPNLIDDRVKTVMIRDIDEYFDRRRTWDYKDDECDYQTWIGLYDYLKAFKVGEKDDKETI